MWCYRRILKISWTEKVTNQEVCRRINRGESLVKNIAKRKMRFAGHVIRGSCGELTSLVIEGMVEGKRDKGQQRRKWDDDVKNWSRITRFGDIKRKAEDKLAWRDMVANLHIEDDT